MKIILKSLVYFLFFLMMLIAFLPKENIYYFALEQLNNKKIELNQNKIDDGYFKFIVDELQIKYDGLKVSDISNVEFDMFIYQTKIDISNIKVDNSFSKFVPNKIDTLTLSHTIINPLSIDINSKFNLGFCTGTIDLLNRVVKLDIVVAKAFKTKYRYIVKELKKSKERSNTKEEVYTYEYKF